MNISMNKNEQEPQLEGDSNTNEIKDEKEKRLFDFKKSVIVHLNSVDNKILDEKEGNIKSGEITEESAEVENLKIEWESAKPGEDDFQAMLKKFIEYKDKKRGLKPTFVDLKTSLEIYELESKLNTLFNDHKTEDQNEKGYSEYYELRKSVNSFLKSVKAKLNQYRVFLEGTENDKENLIYLQQEINYIFDKIIDVHKCDHSAGSHTANTCIITNVNNELIAFKTSWVEAIKINLENPTQDYQFMIENLRKGLDNKPGNKKEKLIHFKSLLNIFHSDFFESFSKRLRNQVENYTEYNFEHSKDEEKYFRDYAFLVYDDSKKKPAIVYLSGMNNVRKILDLQPNQKAKLPLEKNTSPVKPRTTGKNDRQTVQEPPKRKENESSNNQMNNPGNKYLEKTRNNANSANLILENINKTRKDNFDNDSLFSVGISKKVTNMAVSEQGDIIAMTTLSDEKLFNIFYRSKEDIIRKDPYKCNVFSSERKTNSILITKVKSIHLLKKITLEGEGTRLREKSFSSDKVGKSKTSFIQEKEPLLKKQKEKEHDITDLNMKSNVIFEIGEDSLINIYKFNSKEFIFEHSLNLNSELGSSVKVNSLFSIVYIDTSNMLFLGAEEGKLIKLRSISAVDKTNKQIHTLNKLKEIRYLAWLPYSQENMEPSYYIFASDSEKLAILNQDLIEVEVTIDLKKESKIYLIKRIDEKVLIGTLDNKGSLDLLYVTLKDSKFIESKFKNFGIVVPPSFTPLRINVINNNFYVSSTGDNDLTLLITSETSDSYYFSKSFRIINFKVNMNGSECTVTQLEELTTPDIFLKNEKSIRTGISEEYFDGNMLTTFVGENLIKINSINFENPDANNFKPFWRIIQNIAPKKVIMQVDNYLKNLHPSIKNIEHQRIFSFEEIGHSKCKNKNSCISISRTLNEYIKLNEDIKNMINLIINFGAIFEENETDLKSKFLGDLLDYLDPLWKGDKEICQNILNIINELENIRYVDEKYKDCSYSEQVDIKFEETSVILTRFSTNRYQLTQDIQNIFKTKNDLDKKSRSAQINPLIDKLVSEYDMDYEALLEFALHLNFSSFKFFSLNKKLAILNTHLNLFIFDFNKRKSTIQPLVRINVIKLIKDYESLGDIHIGFMEENNLFLMNSYNERTDLYFIKNYEKNNQPFNNFKSKVNVFVYNQQILVLGLKSHEIALIDLKSASFRITIAYPHCLPINCLAINQNSKKVASGSEDETLKISDCDGQLIKTIRYNSGEVIGLAFMPDDQYLAATYRMVHTRNGFTEYKLYFFRWESEECLFNIGFPSMIELIRSPFTYVGALKDNEITVNNIDGDFIRISNYVGKERPILQNPKPINSIYLGCDSERSISFFGGNFGELQFYPSNSMDKSNILKELPESVIYCICLSKNPDNPLKLAVGFDTGLLKVYRKTVKKSSEEEEKKEEDKFLNLEPIGKFNEKCSVQSMSFSSNDRYLFCGLDNGKISAYLIPRANENLLMAKLIRCKLHKGVISDLEFSPIAQNFSLLTGSHDKKVKLTFLEFSKLNNEKIVKIVKRKEFKTHKGAVLTVMWSADGSSFLSGGEDKMIIIYDSETLTVKRKLKNQLGSVWNAEFFPSDSNMVISSGESQTIVVTSVISGLEVQRFKVETGSDIWDFIYKENEDRLVFANDQGLYELYPFLNNNKRLIHIKNVLQLKDVPVRLPEDLNILPLPLKMNRLQFAIGMNQIKYIDDLWAYFKTKSDHEDSDFSHIYPLLYSCDWEDNDSWDYSEKYSADNRNRIQRRMIDLHLMMKKECRRFLHLIKDKVKIIKITKKYFPEKLLDMFETFFTEPFYLPIEKKLIQEDTSKLTSPFPNSEIINQLLNPKKVKNSQNTPMQVPKGKVASEEPLDLNDRGKKIYLSELAHSSNDKYYKHETIEIKLITFQISFGDIKKIIDLLNKMDVEDKIFGSENLLRVVNFYWDEIYKFWFFVSLFSYLFYLIFVNLLILRSFVNRVEFCTETCSDNLMNETLAYKIIILTFLVTFFIREVMQLTLQRLKTFWEKFISHFSSLWNLIDIIMITSGVFSVLLDFQGGPGNDECGSSIPEILKYSYSLFFFFSWMRFLDFARGIDKLSFLIRLLARVTSDMFGFIIVLIYMIFGFGLMSYVVQKSYAEHTYSEYLRIFYMVLLGNYDSYLAIDPNTHLNEDYSFFIIVCVSIIMVILMLNMLIALISESHERVMEIEKQANIYEKMDLINGMVLFDKLREKFKKPEPTDKRNSQSQNENKNLYCSFLILQNNESNNSRELSKELVESLILKLNAQDKKIEDLKSISRMEQGFEKDEAKQMTPKLTLEEPKKVPTEGTENSNAIPAILSIIQNQEKNIEKILSKISNLEKDKAVPASSNENAQKPE